MDRIVQLLARLHNPDSHRLFVHHPQDMVSRSDLAKSPIGAHQIIHASGVRDGFHDGRMCCAAVIGKSAVRVVRAVTGFVGHDQSRKFLARCHGYLHVVPARQARIHPE